MFDIFRQKVENLPTQLIRRDLSKNRLWVGGGGGFGVKEGVDFVYNDQNLFKNLPKFRSKSLRL